MKNMGIKTSNGILNFFYRILIEADDVKDEGDLSIESKDATEATLAKSQEEIDGKVNGHFSSNAGKGRGQFKVDKSELQPVKENPSKEEREVSREDEGREME